MSIWTYFHNTLRSIQLLCKFTKLPASKQRNKHKYKHKGRISHSRTLYFSLWNWRWRVLRVLNLMTGNCWFTTNSQLPGEPVASEIPQEERKWWKSRTFQGFPGGSARRNSGSIPWSGRCQGATKYHNWDYVLEPGSCNYWRLRALESMLRNKKRPPQREAWSPCLEITLYHHNPEEKAAE